MIHFSQLALVLLCCAVSFSARCDESFDRAVGVSQMGRSLERMKRAWYFGVSYLKTVRSIEGEDKNYEQLTNYVNLNIKEQDKLIKQRPELKRLIGFVRPASYLAQHQAVKDAYKSLDEVVKKDPQKFRDLIQQHYATDREISADLFDRLLDIRYDEAEKTIKQEDYTQYIYPRYSTMETQTSYEEIRSLFKQQPPSPGDVVYDLGSGYGRLLFYGASLFPQVTFKGIEIVKERADAVSRVAESMKFTNVKQIHQDVLLADYSDGTYFYLYNPFPSLMPPVLEQLRKIAKRHKIVVIARGASVWDFARMDWLKPLSPLNDRAPVVFTTK